VLAILFVALQLVGAREILAAHPVLAEVPLAAFAPCDLGRNSFSVFYCKKSVSQVTNKREGGHSPAATVTLNVRFVAEAWGQAGGIV